MSVGPLTTPPNRPQERTTPWAAIGFGVVFVAVAATLIWFLAANRKAPVQQANPYAPNLKVTDVKLSTAQNFVGARVIYVDGRVTNGGSMTVSHATVQAEFRDDMNQVVLREQVPLMVTEQRPGYSDSVDLGRSPLKPSETRNFRLTFEGVPGSWNQAYPDLRVYQVTTQ
jgi:hypothetical protein